MYRHNPNTNKYQELSTIDSGVDIDNINVAIDFIKKLEIPSGISPDEEFEYIEDLPSGRKLKLTFVYHPDYVRIKKYEYIGSVVSCNLSNELNILTGRQMEGGPSSFGSVIEACTFIDQHFDRYIAYFNKYKKKPRREQVISYVQSLSDEDIQRIKS